MQTQCTSIGIADEITLLRNALKRTLSQQAGLDVVFDVPNIPDLFETLPDNKVDVLLLDTFTNKGCIKSVILSLKEKFPTINLLILSQHIDYKTVSELLELGINGFIPKTADLNELINGIMCASRSILYKNKIVTDSFYWKANARLNNSFAPQEMFLSDMERKIIQLLWEDKNTQEIAQSIFSSVSTVEKIKQKLKQKVGSSSTIGLIKYALKEKIIHYNTDIAQ
jgi:DNA-binding NarL/FixJ family response regulator